MNLIDYVKRYTREVKILNSAKDIENLPNSTSKDKLGFLLKDFENEVKHKTSINSLIRSSYIDRWEGDKLLKENSLRTHRLRENAKVYLSKGFDLRTLTESNNPTYALTLNKIKELCDSTDLIFIPYDMMQNSKHYSTNWYNNHEDLTCELNSYVLCTIDSIDLKKVLSDESLIDSKYIYLGKFQEAFDNLTISLPIIKNLDDSQRSSTFINLDKRLETMTKKSCKAKSGWYGVFHSVSKDDDYLCYITHNKLKYNINPVKDIDYELPAKKVVKPVEKKVDKADVNVKKGESKLIETYQGIEIREDDKGLFYFDRKNNFDSDNFYKTSSAIKSAIRAYVNKNKGDDIPL